MVDTKETNIPVWLVRTASLFALLLATGLAAGQVEWSAVVVDTGKEDAPTSLKIYFGGEKVRLEPQIWVRGSAPGPFILFDRPTRTGVVIVPADHGYMDAPSEMIEPYRGYAADWNIDTFCAGWLKTQQNRGGTCKELSDESVNGREALRYEAANSNGAITRLWFDRKLRMMVKWEAGKNGGEMRNIQEGPQPSAIFEIPAGYTKSKMIFGTISATPNNDFIPSAPKGRETADGGCGRRESSFARRTAGAAVPTLVRLAGGLFGGDGCGSLGLAGGVSS